MEIVRQPQGVLHALRRMNQYGILGAYIPRSGASSGRCSTTCSMSTPWTNTS